MPKLFNIQPPVIYFSNKLYRVKLSRGRMSTTEIFMENFVVDLVY